MVGIDIFVWLVSECWYWLLNLKSRVMRLAGKQGLVVLCAWSEPAIGVIDDHNDDQNDDGGQRDEDHNMAKMIIC